jgi:hypothetical protein
VWLIGAATKMQCLRRSWALPNDSKHNEVSLSKISTDLLCLSIAQMSRCRDLAIFVLINRQTDRTDCFTPCCACARGVIKISQRANLYIGGGKKFNVGPGGWQIIDA